MPNKTKIFFALYMAAGLACLAIMVIAHIPAAANALVREDRQEFGGLYDACKVAAFKIPWKYDGDVVVPPDMDKKAVPQKLPINDCRVVIMGDSFFENSFARMFERVTGLPTFNIYVNKQKHKGPEVLDDVGFSKNETTKYVIFEIIERRIIIQLRLFGKTRNNKVRPLDGLFSPIAIKADALEFLVTQNPAVFRLLEIRNTYRFNQFGLISKNSPYYSVDPPMLFYSLAILANHRQKRAWYIKNIADIVEDMDRTLQDKYGLKMIFMPIPNKFTVYGYRYDEYNFNYSGEVYDDFLPKLYAELDKRGIEYIDLYTDFMNHKDGLLYHPSDSHWNSKGKSIAMVKLVSKLDELEAASSGHSQPPENVVPHTP